MPGPEPTRSAHGVVMGGEPRDRDTGSQEQEAQTVGAEAQHRAQSKVWAASH